ncbi:MAG: hypothetical protein JSV89_22135 [Spirochaetaceae bacterium]|nr:MAG: hypothetical protein JSV89_22135 [Spirochaetaceae bacterium]
MAGSSARGEGSVGLSKRIIGLVMLTILSLSSCMSTHYLAPTESSEFLKQRMIYIVLDNGTELQLKRCVLQEDLLIGFTPGNMPIEVELSRIRVAYYKKLKNDMVLLGAFSAGAGAVALWLILGAFTAPSDPI